MHGQSAAQCHACCSCLKELIAYARACSTIVAVSRACLCLAVDQEPKAVGSSAAAAPVLCHHCMRASRCCSSHRRKTACSAGGCCQLQQRQASRAPGRILPPLHRLMLPPLLLHPAAALSCSMCEWICVETAERAIFWLGVGVHA